MFGERGKVYMRNNIEWPSKRDFFEAIGFLARPGVVSAIEATVPEDGVERFRKEFAGRYSDNYPYTAQKYGSQFRIYLDNIEGCPDFLLSQLDDAYKNRINNTGFIRNLVLNFGFRFTNEQQNIVEIMLAMSKVNKKEYIWFLSAFEGGYGKRFIDRSVERIGDESELPIPVIKQAVARSTKKRDNAIINGINYNENPSIPKSQLLTLGWCGEKYIYIMLLQKFQPLLEKLHIDHGYTVEWFNKGFDQQKIWNDLSIGKGCDMIVHCSKRNIHIEVKTSQRKTNVFVMTSNEMQMMQQFEDEYYIVKIDYFEKLLKTESPEIRIFEKPFKQFFTPKSMLCATFKIE